MSETQLTKQEKIEKMQKGRSDAKAKKETELKEHKTNLEYSIKESQPDLTTEGLIVAVDKALEKEALESDIIKCTNSLHKAMTKLDNFNNAGEKMVSAKQLAKLIS